MAHDVFISYSSANKQIADAVAAHLESRGIRCWYAPRDIRPGEDWADAIIGGLCGAKAMVLIYTDDSNGSEQVLREAAFAADNGLVIIPFRLSRTKPNDRLKVYLKKTHWLDAVNKDMAVSIQKLGRHTEEVIDKIVRRDTQLAFEQQRGLFSRLTGIIVTAVVVVIAAVIALALILPGGDEADQNIEPEDSSVVSTVDGVNNGVTSIHLTDRLVCATEDMTCDEFIQRFAAALEKTFGGSGYEIVRAETNLGFDILKDGEKTPWNMVFLDGDNAMIGGDREFCTVGILDTEDPGLDQRRKVTEALILAAYPGISDKDAEELSVVMCVYDAPVHAWSGIYELYCEAGPKFSFTILNSDRYND